jgi:RNA polymerase sigma-70 factor, ECF subfamily
MTAGDEFARLTDPFRRIATNACLTALEHRGRRALPSELVGPTADPRGPFGAPRHEVAWLQPIPDALLAAPADPATIVASRGSIRLALIAALQHLPARQRAVLILRDVLAWRATEVADLLGTTAAAVNSALQRARAELAQVTPVEDQIAEPTQADQRELLDRYVDAFVNADVAALARLLRDDVELEMSPFLIWFTGRDAVGSFLAAKIRVAPDTWRLVPTSANGQPAVAAYRRGQDGVHHAFLVQVFTMAGSGIARMVAFRDPRLFPTFGLPPALPEGVPAPRR